MISKLLFYAALTLALDAKPAEVITSLYIAPQFQFKLESGTVLPHDVLMCEAQHKNQQYGDHIDSFIVWNCDNGVVLKLDNVLFPIGKIAVKIESIHEDHGDK